ncbi:MAG: hypothetical protein UF383_09385, partial [Oscillospiraceae bacterium]|nr:hypothetical protein [Oscillospiraceae bacterium]
MRRFSLEILSKRIWGRYRKTPARCAGVVTDKICHMENSPALQGSHYQINFSEVSLKIPQNLYLLSLQHLQRKAHHLL